MTASTAAQVVDERRNRYEQLTRVGPGTPMGEYQRRFWHPIAASVELKRDGELPALAVKVLGEKLTLFRGEDGTTLGLIAERCPHRGTALSYGIVEGDCIRCPYHSWKFDKTGQCVDQPGESPGSTLKDRIKITAYPVQEMGGLIWAYLGPAPAPLLPRIEFMVREDYDHDIGITRVPCNWLQIAENNLDPVHIEFLHMKFTNYVRKRKGLSTIPVRKHAKLDFEVFEYGIIKKRLWVGDREDSPEWTVGHPHLFPQTTMISYHNGWVQLQIRTPVDDTHTHFYWYNCRPRKPGDPAQLEVPFWENPWANEEGKYIPEEINAQDMMVLISQGEIADRTQENLGETDKGVVLYRRTLLREIERVQAGEDPLGVIRDPAKNTPWISLPIEEETSMDFNGVRASATYDAPTVTLSTKYRSDLPNDARRE
jgi:5,5'-dehydrodivanillate O-demethylase